MYTLLFADAENLVKYHEKESDVVAFDLEGQEYRYHPMISAWLPEGRASRTITKIEAVLAPIWHRTRMAERFGRKQSET